MDLGFPLGPHFGDIGVTFSWFGSLNWQYRLDWCLWAAWDWKWDLNLGLACVVYTVKTMVFEGFTVLYKVGIYVNLGGFGLSFWKVFGYLGRHFGGLERSWDHCRISMDFRVTQILSSTGVGGGLQDFWGPVTDLRSLICCLQLQNYLQLLNGW